MLKPPGFSFTQVAPGSSEYLAQWAPPNMPSGPSPIGYEIQYRRAEQAEWQAFASVGDTETSVTASVAVTPPDALEARIRAIYAEGASDWIVHTGIAHEVAPPPSPSNFAVSPYHGIEISWGGNDPVNDPERRIEVEIAADSEGQSTTWQPLFEGPVGESAEGCIDLRILTGVWHLRARFVGTETWVYLGPFTVS